MQIAYDTLKFMFFFVAILCLLLLLLAIYYGCSYFKDRSSSSKLFRGVVLSVIALLVCVFMAVPCGLDLLTHNIILVEGQYVNGDTSKSSGSRLGLHGVSIKTEEDEIILTTALGHSDIFQIGTFRVVAYYSGRSRLLLYMEIIE